MEELLEAVFSMQSVSRLYSKYESTGRSLPSGMCPYISWQKSEMDSNRPKHGRHHEESPPPSERKAAV
jgi:hypothetical protein